MPKKPQYDTLLFAVILISISGACLAYNIRTAEQIGSTPAITEMIITENSNNTLISTVAAANISHTESVEVSANPSESNKTYEILPPIITPPSK